MTARPGRKPTPIAPFVDTPDVTLLSILARLEALLDRTPLNERAALGMTETAVYLSVSVETVKALKTKGLLTPLDMPFERVLFSRESIDAFVAACHEQAATAA